jgi:hypothetical protein
MAAFKNGVIQHDLLSNLSCRLCTLISPPVHSRRSSAMNITDRRIPER